MVGLFTTGKHFTRGSITLQYPEEKWTMPERSRGIVVLLSDKETGKLNCTACMLCMRSCPVGAIHIDQHKDEVTKKRVLDDFIVDHTICCFCGMCEEACNFAAIKLATYYENSTYDKTELIENMDKLQEMGRDVPYEKPVRKKKPVVRKPVAKKPEVAPDKPVEAKEEKKAEETKIETGEASSQKEPAKAETEEKKEKPAADEDKTE